MKLQSIGQTAAETIDASHIVVHYNEVGLKGRNRGRFENRLVKNLRRALQTVDSAGEAPSVQRLFGRLAIRIDPPTNWRRVAQAASRVYGVSYLVPAVSCASTLDELRTTTGRLIAGIDDDPRFAVQCKRSSKSLPFDSMDVQRQIGAHVQGLKGWPVNLNDPELVIRIELVNNAAFVALSRIDGPGGLPSGVSGRVVCLQSGGIDSPVAAYRMLLRGSVPSYVHFHSYPHTGIESQQKVQDLVAKVHPVGIPSRLYMVPFTELQRRIVTDCRAGLRVILYRRFMVRVAAAIAASESALALVTGESLGQVASQTLENLHTIDAACPLPILRPLIGMDKIEIIATAKRIGTYETSIEPHDDCCSYLMPANPVTHSTPADLSRAEEIFDVDSEVESLVQKTTVLDVGR